MENKRTDLFADFFSSTKSTRNNSKADFGLNHFLFRRIVLVGARSMHCRRRRRRMPHLIRFDIRARARAVFHNFRKYFCSFLLLFLPR